MPTIVIPLIVMAGFLLAAFTLTLSSHWLALLLGLLGIDTGKPKGRIPRRRLGLIPLMALHPTTWLLAAIPYFTYQAVAGHLARGWLWLIGGFYLGVVGLSAVTYVTVRKIRKQQRERV